MLGVIVSAFPVAQEYERAGNWKRAFDLYGVIVNDPNDPDYGEACYKQGIHHMSCRLYQSINNAPCLLAIIIHLILID
jgi:hypothetical protein